MEFRNSHHHLSQISTAWTMLVQAHQPDSGEARAARQAILDAYGGPVYRYLLAAVRDQEAANDLFQEFALRFVRGDFKRAQPDRGRFRDFLKTSLYHLIVDHHRRCQRQAAPLPMSEVQDAAAMPHDSMASDGEFVSDWRNKLLERAWDQLEQYEKGSGQPFYTILRLRTDHPDLDSPELAVRLSGILKKPLTANWVRKRLHYARRKLVEILLNDVRQTLDPPTDEHLHEELAELGLLDYCRAFLNRS